MGKNIQNQNDKMIWHLRRYLAVTVFILGAFLVVHAEPATLISIGVSLAISAATTTVTYLLTPKPKPVTQDKNKLNATDIQASYISVGSALSEIYGKKQGDGVGGTKIGGNYFYLSDIRHSITTTSSTAGGTGGGKGGRNRQTTTTQEHHYHQDIGLMIGMGPLEVLEIRAGTKVLYKNNPKPPAAAGTSYQAEAGSYTNSGIDSNPSLWTNGQALGIGAGGTVTISVAGDGNQHIFYLYYYSAGTTVNVTINGLTQSVYLPDTFGRVETVSIIGGTVNGATTFYLQAPSGGLFLDKIVLGEKYVNTESVLRLGAISGTKDPYYTNPKGTYDYVTLDNPLLEDWRPANEYNYQANPNTQGETVLDLPAGCTLRIYEGNGSQLPDPVIEAHYSSRGLGACAFRHRCYFILENFEITEYGGSTPQITVLVQHKTIDNLGKMYEFRAKKAGLNADEMDFSDFYNISLRGFPITNNQSPKSEMERLNTIFDIDIYEDSEGVLIGIVPDETVIATLDLKDIDYSTEESSEQKAVESTYKTDDEIPRQLNVTAFDPAKDYELGNAVASREVTVSKGVESFESNLVLTNDELQKIAVRMHQKMHCEKDPATFKTAYRHAYINPTDLVKVQNLDSSYSRVRIKARNGGFPGVMTFNGVERDLLEPFPRIFQLPSNNPIDPFLVDLPAHIIGTLIDVEILRTSENVPGIYAACARTDSLYQWKGAGLYWEREAGYELLSTQNLEATIGRTISGPAGVLGAPVADENGWSSQSVTFDLFHGELESKSDAEVLDRSNIILIGSELLSFATASRVVGYPNRWTITRLRRSLRSTVSNAHNMAERVVLLNDAVKFIPLDVSEFDQTRNYKFVGGGQDVESASRFAFTWAGKTKYNTAAYQIADSGIPLLYDEPFTISDIGNQILVEWKKPEKNAATATRAQMRIFTPAHGAFTEGEYSASAASIQISDAGNFPPSGKAYVALDPGETIAFAVRTGMDGRILEFVERGVEKSTAQVIPNGTFIMPIDEQRDLWDAVYWKLEKVSYTRFFGIRYQNGYFMDGGDGWSRWATIAIPGTAAPIEEQPSPPQPPPPVDPPLPEGAEEPLNPIYVSTGRYKEQPIDY